VTQADHYGRELPVHDRVTSTLTAYFPFSHVNDMYRVNISIYIHLSICALLGKRISRKIYFRFS